VRAVAVLVVATPCPLLLAVPAAVVAGLSTAAKRGIIIKGGSPLERVAKAKVLLLNKTGTFTAGKPVVRDVVAAAGLSADDALRVAGSLDQVSSHVLASAVVRAARERSLRLSLPAQVHDVPGQGLRAVLDGDTVAVGKATFVSSQPPAPWVVALKRRAELDGSLTVFVGRGDVAIGALVVEDRVRLDARATVRSLRRQGLDRIVMVTGDRWDVGEGVGATIGVDEVYADRSPGDKVDVARLEQRLGPAMMVGDGINDAGAGRRGVGVALGARSATVASEAADVVIVVDRLDRLAEAVGISRRALRIARQSLIVGMGLASMAMVIASLGWLPPAWGALLQELIDVAVIANALRALAGRGLRRATGGARADRAIQSRAHRARPLGHSAAGGGRRARVR
jgi:P-type E1-E2 ATPase